MIVVAAVVVVFMIFIVVVINVVVMIVVVVVMVVRWKKIFCGAVVREGSGLQSSHNAASPASLRKNINLELMTMMTTKKIAAIISKA